MNFSVRMAVELMWPHIISSKYQLERQVQKLASHCIACSSSCPTNLDNCRMHKFSLRESVVVEERRLRTKAQTMEKMNRLEIWLQVLRSDFTTAARVHGPDEQIKRTWGFPPWPVEMESLGAGRVQRNWVGSP